jgi:oligopeptide/dipeptide ABC transporter ATP-binding protein
MSIPVPLLDVRDLRKRFEIRRGVLRRPAGHVKAVENVSFTIGRQEVLGLAGESGSGKSTVGRSLLRLIEPTSGSILFDGIDLLRLDRAELRQFRRRAQIVFQDPLGSLDPRMTIAESVSEPLVVQGLVRSERLARDRVAALLDLVALGTEYMDRRPGELSGGQRQRVGIARALAVEPEFIVADEPVSALDVSIQAQIVNLLADLRTRLGLAILLISHDIAVMAYLCDRIAVMYLGRIMEIASSRHLVRSPQHPYTAALLSAVPSADPDIRRDRQLLEGDVPNPVDPPSGCVFRTRCPHALPECSRTAPPLREVAVGHFKACLRDDIA